MGLDALTSYSIELEIFKEDIPIGGIVKKYGARGVRDFLLKFHYAENGVLDFDRLLVERRLKEFKTMYPEDEHPEIWI